MTATLDGASWQRCRTHYAANLMSATPKSSWGWVKAMLHSIYDQPDASAVHAQFDRVIDTLAEKLPAVAEHLDEVALGLDPLGQRPDVGVHVPSLTRNEKARNPRVLQRPSQQR